MLSLVCLRRVGSWLVIVAVCLCVSVGMVLCVVVWDHIQLSVSSSSNIGSIR